MVSYSASANHCGYAWWQVRVLRCLALSLSGATCLQSARLQQRPRRGTSSWHVRQLGRGSTAVRVIQASTTPTRCAAGPQFLSRLAVLLHELSTSVDHAWRVGSRGQAALVLMLVPGKDAAWGQLPVSSNGSIRCSSVCIALIIREVCLQMSSLCVLSTLQSCLTL